MYAAAGTTPPTPATNRVNSRDDSAARRARTRRREQAVRLMLPPPWGRRGRRRLERVDLRERAVRALVDLEVWNATTVDLLREVRRGGLYTGFPEPDAR